MSWPDWYDEREVIEMVCTECGAAALDYEGSGAVGPEAVPHAPSCPHRPAP